SLPVFDRIPPTKLGLLPLIAKFALGDKSIAVKTEALGPQRFHGRVVVLVNEHSASASEMIAAFAAENKLATIVGEKTAGRVVGANSFKVGYGYGSLYRLLNIGPGLAQSLKARVSCRTF